MLEAKQRAIQDVEEFRRRRLVDLQAELDRMRGVYSEQFPGIISLRQDIAALSRESPQTAALREEERQLRNELARLPGGQAAPVAHAPAPRLPRAADASSVDEDERVREARAQYQSMAERLNVAQLDLDAARAAFKYRYNVIWPAQLPRKPVSPDAARTLGLGTVAALLLAIALAVALDLVSGRVVERWQLEKSLGIAILAEVAPDER
jgi:hypothetical protein